MGNNNVTYSVPGGAGGGSKVPGDLELLRPYFDLVRRLRKAAITAGGPAVVQISVVVDKSGAPCDLWTTPSVTKLEPQSRADDVLQAIVKALTND